MAMDGNGWKLLLAAGYLRQVYDVKMVHDGSFGDIFSCMRSLTRQYISNSFFSMEDWKVGRTHIGFSDFEYHDLSNKN